MNNLLTNVIASILDVELLNRTTELTEKLREEAAKAGWPTIVTMQMSIVINGDDFDVDIPAEIREQVEILEYGTENTPPSPVIRNFLKNLHKKVGAL